jgi:hypothetical protein
MEDVHGVDVSWIHHCKKGASTRPANGENDAAQVNGQPQHQNGKGDVGGNRERSLSQSSSQKEHLHLRPHLLHRNSSERMNSSGDSTPAASSIGTPSPPMSRRGSWLSSLSSKLSSNPSPTAASTPESKKEVVTRSRSNSDKSSPPVQAGAPATNVQEEQKVGSASPPAGKPSFLQSALRKLSSSSTTVAGSVSKVAGGGGHKVERRIMNVDPYRDRCKVQELDVSKLKRVAFCVDVEVAANPRYITDDDLKKSKSKTKDKKIKEKGEAEALKHPEEVVKEKEAGVVVEGEDLGPDGTGSIDTTVPGDDKKEETSTKKKEKKKRSEEERKERKEKKRRQAEANGTVPIEVTIGEKAGSGSNTPAVPGQATPIAGKDKPTTDPLRIYRRCCQLRETPILKKIADQLSSPRFPSAIPGAVIFLDLSGYWMQLADLMTLGDFLSVVPVKKLHMENCGLGDEAVRTILAGLLAVRAPIEDEAHSEAPKDETESAKKARKHMERHSFVEKLNLKNNPSIGRDGWRYISLFINMSRSLKAIDLSLIPLPTAASATNGHAHLSRTNSGKSSAMETISLLSKAIAERLAGPHLEELVLAECGLDAHHISEIVDGVLKSGCKRLGLAGNNLGETGMQHIARYLRACLCEGLDIGGNDIRDHIGPLVEALCPKNPLLALSIADCNINVAALSPLLPALISLPEFRFLDLSHNPELFGAGSKQDALPLLRKYLPKMHVLKRLHLADVSLSPDRAIALAEVLPEIPSLAHINILENPQITALAKSARTEAAQEEASALYASLMSAVKVSSTIVAIDVDVPSAESGEIVKALAKQVVAYCLRNMERNSAGNYGVAAAAMTEPHQKVIPYDELLRHLVGPAEDHDEENADEDVPATDEDYVVGGTGVAKALGACLSSWQRDSRRASREGLASGAVTPTLGPGGDEVGQFGGKGKAKDMSKNLLMAARKIKARVQQQIVKEANMGNADDMACSKIPLPSMQLAPRSFNIEKLTLSSERLQFLDKTLSGVINRFEEEYPECRIVPLSATTGTDSTDLANDGDFGIPSLSADLDSTSLGSGSAEDALVEDLDVNSDIDEELSVRPSLSRHNSDVSLAARALSKEEGSVHKFGQRIRREILRPQTMDHHHGTTGQEGEPEHLRLLREKFEDIKGEELRDMYVKNGEEGMIAQLGNDVESFQRLAAEDPEV